MLQHEVFWLSEVREDEMDRELVSRGKGFKESQGIELQLTEGNNMNRSL